MSNTENATPVLTTPDGDRQYREGAAMWNAYAITHGFSVIPVDAIGLMAAMQAQPCALHNLSAGQQCPWFANLSVAITTMREFAEEMAHAAFQAEQMSRRASR